MVSMVRVRVTDFDVGSEFSSEYKDVEILSTDESVDSVGSVVGRKTNPGSLEMSSFLLVDGDTGEELEEFKDLFKLCDRADDLAADGFEVIFDAYYPDMS